MAPIKLDDNEAYKSYKLLNERPLGMKPFGKDENGLLVVGPGELFCRKDVMTEQERYDAQLLGNIEYRLCESKHRYSHTGNLRAHLKGSHKTNLPEVRKGTNSAHNVRQSARFFENTMRMHILHVNANAQGKAVSDYGDDDEMSTPAKEKPRPPVVPRRPSLPVKKDNTPHKGQMRIISTITHKCNGCKRAKEKICPPTKRTEDCDVWNYFTDDEEEDSEEEDAEEEDDDEVVAVSSPLSASETLSDNEDQ